MAKATGRAPVLARDQDPDGQLLDLRQLARRYERTLRGERTAADNARVAMLGTERAYQVASGLLLRASQRAMHARRVLADAVVRLLVRGHIVDCPCGTCTLERVAVKLLKPRRRGARKGARG